MVTVTSVMTSSLVCCVSLICTGRIVLKLHVKTEDSSSCAVISIRVLLTETVMMSFVLYVELESYFRFLKLSCSFSKLPVNSETLYIGSAITFISPV